MTSRFVMTGFVALGALLVGCASPYQNGYGNPYGYGGAPMGGSGFGAPAYGAPAYGSPQYGAPAYGGPPPGVIGSPTPAGGAPVWTPAPGASSEPGGSTTFAPNGGERPVPSYNDPTRPDGSVPPSDLGGSVLTDPNTDQIRKPSGANSTPASPNTSGLTDPSNERIAALGDESIRLPNDLQPASNVDLQPTPDNMPNPYDHDRAGYKWLRGIVNYDPADRVWRVTYDRSGRDAYGGSFGLLPDERFASAFAEGRVHIVEGFVDAGYRDHFGQPMYRVNKAMRLRPARR
jgi:hypothetical protein